MKHQFKYVHDFEIKWDGRRKNPDFQVFVKSARGFEYRPYSSYSTGRTLEAVLADLRYAVKEECVGKNHDAQRGNVMYRIEHHNPTSIRQNLPEIRPLGLFALMQGVPIYSSSKISASMKALLDKVMRMDSWRSKGHVVTRQICYPAMYSNSCVGAYQDPGMRAIMLHLGGSKAMQESHCPSPIFYVDSIRYGCRDLVTLGEYYRNDKEMFEIMTNLGFKVTKYRARTVYHGLRQSICFKEADQMKLEKVYDEPIEKLLLGT
jgi:hypothetical protein